MTRRHFNTLLTASLVVVPALTTLSANQLPTSSNFTMKYVGMQEGIHGYSAKWQFTNLQGKRTYHGIHHTLSSRDDALGFAALTDGYTDIVRQQMEVSMYGKVLS